MGLSPRDGSGQPNDAPNQPTLLTLACYSVMAPAGQRKEKKDGSWASRPDGGPGRQGIVGTFSKPLLPVTIGAHHCESLSHCKHHWSLQAIRTITRRSQTKKTLCTWAKRVSCPEPLLRRDKP